MPNQVSGDILVHKFRYVIFLIARFKQQLSQTTNSEKYLEILKKIQILTEVRMELAKILNYSAITGIYTES